jgi:hypothetical protein
VLSNATESLRSYSGMSMQALVSFTILEKIIALATNNTECRHERRICHARGPVAGAVVEISTQPIDDSASPYTAHGAVDDVQEGRTTASPSFTPPQNRRGTLFKLSQNPRKFTTFNLGAGGSPTWVLLACCSWLQHSAMTRLRSRSSRWIWPVPQSTFLGEWCHMHSFYLSSTELCGLHHGKSAAVTTGGMGRARTPMV